MDKFKPRMVCDLCKLGNNDTCYVGGASKCLKNGRYTKFKSSSAQPENKPLTLEQLKQMDGEPVWAEGKTMFGTNFSGWRVLSKCNTCDGVIRFENGADLLAKNYGKAWVAYAHKPEVDVE